MFWRCLLLLIFGVTVSCAWGQEADATKAKAVSEAPAADAAVSVQQDLIGFVDAFSKAFNAHNAKALAALWSEKGVHVDSESGERVVGRDAIEKTYAGMFADDDSKMIVVTIDNVRLIAPEVATADGTSTVVDDSSEPSDSTFAAVFVRKDGKWLLDSAHETNLPVPDRPYNHLQALGWMVGEWQDESDEITVRTTCNWAANYSFLKRSYSIVRDGEVARQGTQVIGWDPEAETIRSWNFESDGSFGQGEWTQNGDTWSVKLNAVLADGGRAAATQVITVLDEDTVTSQMVGRERDGEMLPSTDPVTVVRVRSEVEE